MAFAVQSITTIRSLYLYGQKRLLEAVAAAAQRQRRRWRRRVTACSRPSPLALSAATQQRLYCRVADGASCDDRALLDLYDAVTAAAAAAAAAVGEALRRVAHSSIRRIIVICECACARARFAPTAGASSILYSLALAAATAATAAAAAEAAAGADAARATSGREEKRAINRYGEAFHISCCDRCRSRTCTAVARATKGDERLSLSQVTFMTCCR